MQYLLDTNIVSELQRKVPDPKVVDFLAATDSNDHYVSVLTLGELRRGAHIHRRRGNPVADQIDLWIDRTEEEFSARTIPVDAVVSSIWARISSDRSRPILDTYLAATAIAHNLVLVTRNVRDFRGIAMTILNPWDEPISPN